MDLDPSVVWDFAGTLVGTLRERPRQLPATVSRVDPDGTVWLSMPGADGLVPASTTADVGADDAVTVEWWGNAYHVTGNRTSPSVGTRAAAALRRATAAAAKVAGEAKGIADAVGQHFWADDNGVHVSNEDGNATGERNILMNSLGILLRQGSAWLASFSDSAVSFFDGLGNEAENIVARFGRDGAQIGYADESHVEMDYHSFQMLDRELSSYLHVSDMRDHDGYAEIVEYLYGEWVTSGNTVGLSLSPVVGDIPEGYQNSIVAYGIDYPDGHEVQCTFLSSGRVRFDETLQYIQNLVITYVTESPQAKAYTLGVREAAKTVGPMSVCEGMHSAASGFASHAEGYGCESKGIASHSGGRGCKALGEASHASGDTCVAASYAQTVVGMNNVPDYSGEYAFIVGNGGSELSPSNAYAVGWDGTVVTGGDFRTVDPRLDTTASSLAGYTYRAWSIRDANDRTVMYLQAAESAAGMVLTTIAARRVVSGENVDNRLDLRVAADGTRSVVVSDAAAWRSALGLGSSTTNVSVENSTWEGSHVVRNGSVVTVAPTNVRLTSSLASGASRSIGTIPSGYRPPTYVYATAASRTAALSGNLLVQVDSSGVVKVFNFSGSAVGTSDRIYFSCTYCI